MLDTWHLNIYIHVYICRCGKWQYITVCCALYVCLLQNFNQFLYLACERPFHSRYVTSKWTEKRFGLEMRFDTNNFIILCSRFPHPFSSLNNYVSMNFQKKKQLQSMIILSKIANEIVTAYNIQNHWFALNYYITQDLLAFGACLSKTRTTSRNVTSVDDAIYFRNPFGTHRRIFRALYNEMKCLLKLFIIKIKPIKSKRIYPRSVIVASPICVFSICAWYSILVILSLAWYKTEIFSGREKQ